MPPGNQPAALLSPAERPANPEGIRPAGVPGGLIVMALLLLALGLGVFAVWFQRGQTRRCLEFFGPKAARRLQSADRVELWQLASRGGRVVAVDRIDISRAPGLVHLRRGLIEDFNYDWGDGAGEWAAGPSTPEPLPAQAWDQALAFFGSAGPPPGPAGETAAGGLQPGVTIVVFDLDESGAATVVGRPGRVGLGRLRTGLATWMDDARSTLAKRVPAAKEPPEGSETAGKSGF